VNFRQTPRFWLTSKAILQRLRLLFPAPTLADAYVSRMPMFRGRLVFHAPIFCRGLGFCMHPCFVDANNLSTPKFFILSGPRRAIFNNIKKFIFFVFMCRPPPPLHPSTLSFCVQFVVRVKKHFILKPAGRQINPHLYYSSVYEEKQSFTNSFL
jgi:hypothetical protein